MKKKIDKDFIKFSIISVITLTTILPTIKYPAHAITRLFHNEKLDLKDDILDDLIKVYYENDISKENNLPKTIGYLASALTSGKLSIDNTYTYDMDKDFYDYYLEFEYDCILGNGVCKAENSLICEVLNRLGYDTACILTKLHLYVLIFDKERDSKYIYDYTNDCFWKFNDSNEAVCLKFGYKDMTTNPYWTLSLIEAKSFDLPDLFKLSSYENQEDFSEIISDYRKGKKAFTEIDENKLDTLTYDKKQKIKKLEQK